VLTLRAQALRLFRERGGVPMQVVCPQCSAVNRVPEGKAAAEGRCGKCHAALFDGRPVALDASSFERHVSRGDVPVLVDFWAEWCGPCKMMAPVFARAAAALEPSVRLAKLDTEAAPEIAARYGIRSIPTMVLFRGGREVDRTSGAMDLVSLKSWVNGRL